MTTIKDVSRLANVSISTVSRVINKSANVAPEKEKAVLDAMRELNFVPNSFAQALVNRRSNCIGVLVGDLCGGPFFAQMMQGIENEILPANKYVIVMSGNHIHDREKNSIEALLLRRCDALIIHSKALSDEELINIKNNNPDTPFVFVNRLIPSLEDYCVYVDIKEGMKNGVNHLIEKGHKSIAYIASDEFNFPDAKARMDGYKEALEQADIPFDETLVSTAYPSENGGYEAIKNLLTKNNKFSAFVAYNDAMAIGAISALTEADIQIPQQISAIGFDDNPMANFIKPKLTTIRYPIEEVGRRAAKLALTLLNDKNEEDSDKEGKEENQEVEKIAKEELFFIPNLIERASVADLTKQ
ncbi:MAG: LacI family DNA-binding transcriptional regulator [Ruminobacter sp.]|nr:LacI family DNA-binding transcriptional regulator [Ruminobacter sp.]